MLDNLGQNEQINVCDITCCLIIALMVDCVVLENTVHLPETRVFQDFTAEELICNILTRH